MLRLPALCLAGLLVWNGAAAWAKAEPVLLDRVVAIVNDQVIVESDLQRRIAQVRQNLQRSSQRLAPEADLRRQVLERMVTDLALSQRARRVGITVDNTTLDRAIARLAESNGLSVTGLRNQLESEGVVFDQFREDIREEIQITRLREREVEDRLQISESEIDAFLAAQGQSLAQTQELRLAQILIPVAEDASQEVRGAALALAERLAAEIKKGASFVELARTHSKGAAAAEGGSLGWRPADRLPSLFVQAVASLAPGGLAGPLQSPNGYHLVLLEDRRSVSQGPLVTAHKARHILIRVDGQVSEERALRRAQELRQRLSVGDAFDQLARDFSQDPGSAAKGGLLDWAYPGDLVPEFERALNELSVGQISAPVRSVFGFHLIELLERRREPLSQDRLRVSARLALRERKLTEAVSDWMREVRANSYVEIRAQ
ncbi:MAG: peptidylprolyl isomerase [Burkholderiaceae bacterium]